MRSEVEELAPAPMHGRPFIVTNRLVLSIALPMTLAYLTTPLLGITDTAVIGQFGDPAMLGGLAAGAIVFDLVFSTFNFLRAGTTGLVAQAFGSGDGRAEQAAFWRALALAIAIGTVLALAGPAVAWAGTLFIAGEPAVNDALKSYVVVRLLSSPFALANYAILGYVLGRGEGMLGLGLQIVLNGANILLSIWLGLVLGWGIEGVAWGTVWGEMIACMIGLTIVFRRFSALPRLTIALILDRMALKRMFAMNGDIMIRSFVLLFAFALMTRQGAQLGTLTLAVNAVLMNFFLVAGYFLDGFATAAEQLAGRSVGARQRKSFVDAIWLTGLWGFALSGAVAVVVILFGDALVAFITTAPDVREQASIYLSWAALTAVSGVLAFQMDGIFIGATWSRDLRNMMVLSFVLFLAALLFLPGLYGNHGLWAALHVFLIARGLSLAAMVPIRLRQTFGTPA